MPCIIPSGLTKNSITAPWSTNLYLSLLRIFPPKRQNRFFIPVRKLTPSLARSLPTSKSNLPHQKIYQQYPTIQILLALLILLTVTNLPSLPSNVSLKLHLLHLFMPELNLHLLPLLLPLPLLPLLLPLHLRPLPLHTIRVSLQSSTIFTTRQFPPLLLHPLPFLLYL